MTHTSTTSDPKKEEQPCGEEEGASPADTDSLPWSAENLNKDLWEILLHDEED